MESTYQQLTVLVVMMNILHDDGDYLPLIKVHNTNDDMYIFERGVLTTMIKLLMVSYDNFIYAPNKNMACMEQRFINISENGENVLPTQSRPFLFQVSKI